MIKKRNALLTACAVAAAWAMSAGNVFAQALPVYTPPPNKLGGAVAQGIVQSLGRRGFAANDPRIFATVESVGARVIPLVTSAGGAGASWLGIMSRLSPWVMGGVLVYEGLRWYFNSDGTVTTVQDGSAATPGQVTQGGACFYVMGGNYCGATPLEAVTSYILATTVYTHLTKVNLTPEPAGTSAYNSGRRYTSTIEGYRNNDQTVVWPSYTSYQVYLGSSQVTCPGGYVANGQHCVPNLLGNYVPRPSTQTGQTLQQAYDNLPQPVRDAQLHPDLAAEIANRLWRDASMQPDYRGVPWSASQPVQAPDFGPHRTSHPTDWPITSDLNKPVPTDRTPIVAPVTNPNQINPPASSVKVDLGPDPGIQAPTLEEPPSDLFKPIRDLLEPWFGWQVPAHAGQCPTWQAAPSIGGYVFNIDISSHCSFAEQYRSIILAAALAGWIVIAAFIILSA